MENFITIDGINYSEDLATVVSANKDIEVFRLIRGVRCIGKGAFAGCKRLRVVHIPETVIRIEDFAFRDCTDLKELYLPYYMEYISPLAFTLSHVVNGGFNYEFKVFYPRESFLLYFQLIPQHISKLDYGEDFDVSDYSHSDERRLIRLEELSVPVDEDELYRLAIADYFYDNLWDDKMIDFDNVKHEVFKDNEAIYEQALEDVFQKGICSFLKRKELEVIDREHLVNQVDESFTLLIEDSIRTWLQFAMPHRPMELINGIVGSAIYMGFIPAALWDNPNSTKLYHESLYRCIDSIFGGDWENEFYEQEVMNNDALKAFDKRMYIDCGKLIGLFIHAYTAKTIPINVQTMRMIVRQSMRLIMHIGYSYGMIYRNRNNAPGQLELFSEEDMKGGINNMNRYEHLIKHIELSSENSQRNRRGYS